MKILIYGAGAVGGYLGAKLAHAGHDLTLVGRQLLADTINSHGLELSEGNQNIRVQPTALDSIAKAFMGGRGDYDLIIMAMKAYDLRTALDHLVAFCEQPTAVITVQNGIGIEKPLIDQFGSQHVIAGSFTLSVNKATTNSLRVESREGGLALAPTKPKQSLKPLLRLFKQADIKVDGNKSYHEQKWSKALLHSIGNASSAILNRPPQIIYKSEVMFDLELRMLQEMLALMDKLKLRVIDLPGCSVSRLAKSARRGAKGLFQSPLTRYVNTALGDRMPSFHVELTNNIRKNEVIYHNGAIARLGPKYGIQVPVNRAYAGILWKMTQNEIDWQEYDGNLRQLVSAIRAREAQA